MWLHKYFAGLCFVCFGIAVHCAGTAAAAPSNNVDSQGKNIVCYYSSWSAHRPGQGSYTIDDIPVHTCTHLVYTFIGLNNRTWELLVLDPTNDITKGGYRRFTSLKKRKPGLKTLISVGGWVEGGHKYSEMASKPERRKVFVNSVVDFLKWFNFDGLDLDWEFPGSADREGRPEDKDNFLQLANELREAFDKEGWGWSLTAVVPIMPFRVDTGYHVEKLAAVLDHIHLLTYDLRGNWTGFADVHTPLRQRPFDQGDYKNVNINDGVELWERLGAPREKLTVGMSLYGRSYTLADPSNNGLHAPLRPGRTAGHPGPSTKANGTLAYYEICELQREGGWEMKYDDVSESPYMVKGDQWIGYDDRESLVKKVKHFQDKGYGGVTVWAVDLDDFRGLCGEPRILLNAIYKQVTGRSPLSVQTSLPPLPPNVFTTPPSAVIPTVLLTPSRQARPRTTTVAPVSDDRRVDTTLTQPHTPSTLSFFEDSQRLHPKVDHFRTTLSPIDTINSVTQTPERTIDVTTATPARQSTNSVLINAELPKPLTRRPALRRRPTTPRPIDRTTTTHVPLRETVPVTNAETTHKFDKIDTEVENSEPITDAPTTTTTVRPVTRRPFAPGRPLRVRGRPQQRPALRSETDQTKVSRPIGKPNGRSPQFRRTTTTTTEAVQQDVEELTTIPVLKEQSIATTVQPVITSEQPIVPTTQPIVTTTQPIVPTTQSIVTTTQSIGSLTQPIVSSTQPIVTTTQPIVSSTQPIVSSTQPIVSSTQPIVITVQPGEVGPSITESENVEDATEEAGPVKAVTEASAETTTSAKRPPQRRLRKPLGNRTASRLRRPVRTRLANLTEAKLREEESIQHPVFVRYPSPRLPPTAIPPADEAPICVLGGPKYLPHRLCEQYWECNSHKTPPTLRTCQIGLVWNPQSSICDWLTQNARHNCE